MNFSRQRRKTVQLWCWRPPPLSSHQHQLLLKSRLKKIKIKNKLSNQKTRSGGRRWWWIIHHTPELPRSHHHFTCANRAPQSLNDSDDDSKGQKKYMGKYISDRSRCCQLLKMTKHSPQALLIGAQMDNESSPVNPLWSYPGAQLFWKRKKKKHYWYLKQNS